MSASAWVTRLSRCGTLAAADVALLESVAATPRLYAAQEGLAKTGDATECAFVLLEGSPASAVHVNRTLMELRRLKLVTFQNRLASLHDFAQLRAAAGFDGRYLQLEPGAGHP